MTPNDIEVDRPAASIIVGICGKRSLEGKDEAVRAAVAAIFGEVDRRFPATPKILLTALAEGADRIAADEALGRAHWSTTAILPLEPDLYCQDFDPAGAGALRARLADPRLRVTTLPTLIDERTGDPFGPPGLLRKPNVANSFRALHYEQAGLYIANASTLLICVMSGDEQAGKIGGTARIASYRTSGKLDRDARHVIEHSRVLSPVAPLAVPNARPLWLVDLNFLSTTGAPAGRAPFEIRDGSVQSEATSPQDRITRSLRLASAIDRFNRRASSVQVTPSGIDTLDAANYLCRLRSSVSRIQIRAASRMRSAVAILAGLFALAVLSWEIFAERHQFIAGSAGIIFYAGFVAMAIGVHFLARWKLWQPIAEDYRAVSEALRVQIAWWEAGLVGPKFRADNYYLERARGTFGLVREAVCAMIDTAVLVAPLPKPVPNSETAWIKGQIQFFGEHIRKRRSQLIRVELGSWFLFLSSFGSAIFLLSLEIFLREHRLQPLLEHYRTPAMAAASGIAALSGAVLLIVFAEASPQTIMSLSSQRSPLLRPRTWLGAVFIGLALSVAIFCVFPAADTGEAAVAIAQVFFATAAGAIRYIAEKLSWEVELRGYEDAADVFETALDELGKITDGKRPDPKKDERRRQIIFQLGIRALAENENWLRAHRERPLEPVIG